MRGDIHCALATGPRAPLRTMPPSTRSSIAAVHSAPSSSAPEVGVKRFP